MYDEDDPDVENSQENDSWFDCSSAVGRIETGEVILDVETGIKTEDDLFFFRVVGQRSLRERTGAWRRHRRIGAAGLSSCENREKIHCPQSKLRCGWVVI